MKVEAEKRPVSRESGRSDASSVIAKRALVVNDDRAMCVLIQDVLIAEEIEAVLLRTQARNEADARLHETKNST